MNRDWYRKSGPDVLTALDSSDTGLSSAEVAARLARDGRNELTSRAGRSRLAIALDQLRAPMVIVLLVAAGLAAAIGEGLDAAVILLIVLINAAIGYSQEARAERAMAALKQLAVPQVRVRRDGQTSVIPAHDLVVGDIVLLEAGSGVPADGRLIEAMSLRCQESALTGESQPVDKHDEPIDGDERVLADLHNMVFMGTSISYGRGVIVVTATGMRTELGRIADMLQQQSAEATPLQLRLEQLSKALALIALAIVAAIFVLGVLRGEAPSAMFLTAVSLAVAAIPEGLAAVVTIALALGAQRMLKRNALIRRLAAVETLGSVTVICSDKTGTLTENRMTVTVIDVAGRRLRLTRDQPLRADELSSAEQLTVIGGALCNDAQFGADGQLIGDPTEAALLSAAERVGLVRTDLAAQLPRIDERPFDSERKRMSTVHRLADGESETPFAHPLFAGASHVVITKGAVDGLLQIATQCWDGHGPVALNADMLRRVHRAHDELAGSGTRVLGVALRPLNQAPAADAQLEHDLTFVGMLGMVDPARPEARAAVETCRRAGIRPLMITGDHPLTAQAIAHELGIGSERVVLGSEVAAADEAQLRTIVHTSSVFARVDPEHKLRIVAALQAEGEIVAMTGDGVNDAPALQRADIGVAMGITGTDVAKEAADMVLRDDNFATIVSAVAEGRTIYANIRKFIRYLMATNASEILVMLVTPLLGMPLALLPIQILWINLVTDGLPALALSVEPAEADSMRRRPVMPNEHILARGLGWFVLWSSLLMALVVLAVGWWYWRAAHEQWQTMLFLMLTLAQMANVLAIRIEHRPAWTRSAPHNRALYGAVALTVLLQLAVTYVPWLQPIFRTVSLTPGDMAVAFAASALLYLLLELGKWLQGKASNGRG